MIITKVAYIHVPIIYDLIKFLDRNNIAYSMCGETRVRVDVNDNILKKLRGKYLNKVDFSIIMEENIYSYISIEAIFFIKENSS